MIGTTDPNHYLEQIEAPKRLIQSPTVSRFVWMWWVLKMNASPAILWLACGQTAQVTNVQFVMVTVIIIISEPFLIYSKITYVEKTEAVIFWKNKPYLIMSNMPRTVPDSNHWNKTQWFDKWHRFPYSQTSPEIAHVEIFLWEDLWGQSHRDSSGNSINSLPDTMRGLLKMLYYIIPTIFCKADIMNPFLQTEKLRLWPVKLLAKFTKQQSNVVIIYTQGWRIA